MEPNLHVRTLTSRSQQPRDVLDLGGIMHTLELRAAGLGGVRDELVAAEVVPVGYDVVVFSSRLLITILIVACGVRNSKDRGPRWW